MCKHFSGGGPQRDGLDAHHDYGREQVYPGGNFEYHLIPFQAAIEAKERLELQEEGRILGSITGR